MDNKRLENEKLFHDSRFGGNDEIREKADKYYVVNSHVLNRYIQLIADLCKGKEMLEYGCGTGYWSSEWIGKGAVLSAIDISPEGIRKARERIENKGLKADFYVMNAEKTEFPDNRFDIIAGSGIIHHLNLDDAYRELSRLLNEKGHIVFYEPLGHNPFIKIYRALTPRMRTPDEHPLKMSDLLRLKNYFNNVKIEYFSLFTLAAVPLRNKNSFDKFYRFLQKVDEKVFLLPFMRRLAWTVIIHASNPKKP
jgi:SAM-dependent methyltransferase